MTGKRALRRRLAVERADLRKLEEQLELALLLARAELGQDDQQLALQRARSATARCPAPKKTAGFADTHDLGRGDGQQDPKKARARVLR